MSHQRTNLRNYRQRFQKIDLASLRLEVDAFVASFLENVREDGGCWVWTGTKHKQGYGKFHFRKRTMVAHRVSFIIFVGEIPGALKVCHECDNPPCIRPSHLFLGTQADNVADAVRKGRMVTQHGEDHTLAKLSEADVREIRQVYRGRGNGPTLKELGRQFGVCFTTIHKVLGRESWAHVK